MKAKSQSKTIPACVTVTFRGVIDLHPDDYKRIIKGEVLDVSDTRLPFDQVVNLDGEVEGV